MEIQEFAERVLFGSTLEEKLVSAANFSDEQPGLALTTPDLPGRPAELRFKGEGERVAFPKPSALEGEEARGRLLHFFANHELLAAELMALVLLKFPDAPKAFRLGVAKTLAEEQTHTRLYLARMRDLNCSFGQYPVSGYFWEALREMGSPLEYVTGLPLTLEQANLDFSQYFGQLFRTIGDGDSQALMERIHHDEIRHVAYGVRWLRKWKPREETDWEAYCHHLRWPLSPRRARGKGFDSEARLRSGLDRDFIESLVVYSKSRGRPPQVGYFNPFAEWEINQGKGFTPTKQQRSFQKDLEILMATLGGEDDLMLVHGAPRQAFLLGLKQAGLVVPEFEVLEDEALAAESELFHRKLGALRPWAWSPSAGSVMSPLGARSNPPVSAAEFVALEACWIRFDKADACNLLRTVLTEEASDWLCPLSEVGQQVTSLEELHSVMAYFRAEVARPLVVKACFGAAGGRTLRLWEPELSMSQQRWLEKMLGRGERLVVEPWHERVWDFSAHFEVKGQEIKLQGFVALHNDHRGQFLACSQGPQVTSGLDAKLSRFLHGSQGDRYKKLFERIGKRLLERCRDRGYAGPLGVDAYLFRDSSGELQLKPIVEVNARQTMGRIVRSLARFGAAGRIVTLALLARPQLKCLGLASFSDLPGFLADKFPVEIREKPSRRIVGGVLCLTDPVTAQECVAILMVGQESREWLLERLTDRVPKSLQR